MIRVYPDTQKETPSPVLAQPSQESSGGGFWSGVLDLLKNIPITIGDAKRGHQNLGSFNQLTAGRRLVDYGKSQGLDMGSYGQGGSLSPQEAGVALEQAAARRKDEPLGMHRAQQILFPQEGEGPDVASARFMLSQMPRTALPGLLNHLVSTTGELPGMGMSGDSDAFLAKYPSTADLVHQTPLGTQSAVAPMVGARPSAELPTSAVSPATQVQAPVPTSAVAPMAPYGRPLPVAPQRNTGPITREEIASDAGMMAARTPLERRKAQAGAEGRVRAERHKQWTDASKEHTNARLAWAAETEALRPKWTGDPQLNLQLWLDHADLHQPGAVPSREQLQFSTPRSAERQASEEAQKIAATAPAKAEAERQQREAGKRADWTVEQELPLSKTSHAAGLYPVYTSGMAQEVPGHIPTGQALELERYGQVKTIHKEDREDLRNLRQAATIYADGKKYLEKMYNVANSYQASMTPAQRADPLGYLAGHWQQAIQEHPEVLDAARYFDANLMVLARGVAGGKRDLNVQELEAAKGLIPRLKYTMGIIARVGVGLGAAVPIPGVDVPDTKETALSTMDMGINLINSHAQRILGTEDFRFSNVAPRTEDERARARAEMTPPAGPATKYGVPTREGMQGQVGQGLGRPAPPKTPQQTPLQQAATTALKQHGLTQAPNPQQDQAGFQTFMGTVREQVRRYHPGKTPAELDALTTLIAQKLGGTWQRQP